MSLAQELHAAHKARLVRMSGVRAVAPAVAQIAPVHIVAPEVVRKRREYETLKTPSRFMPLYQRILRAVAFEFDLTVSDMISGLREPQYVNARFVAVGLLLEMTNMSLPAIGRRMGGRDHTTMIHARNKAKVMFSEEAFRNRIDQIKAQIA